MLRVLPLFLAIVLVGLFAAASISDRVDTWLTRTAFFAFGGRDLEHDPRREQLLRSAAIGIPYREYEIKTRLHAVGIGLAGGTIGLYIAVGGLLVARSVGVGGALTAAPLDPTGFGAGQVALVGLTGIGIGVLTAIGTHVVRWQIPSVRAEARQREIDAGLSRLVAFTYALSRGGMSFPDVLRTVSANEDIFGEGAASVGVAVRNMDLFNVDLVTAIQDLSEETPSEQFGTFTENLSSVLQSGGDVSTFLREQYERYRDEAEEQQAEILNLLATTAEVYVTVVVAGMLFLVTILLIIGLTVGDTLLVMQLLAYAVIPATNVLFLAYLIEITRPLRAAGNARDRSPTEVLGTVPAATPASDGGYVRPASAANHDRLFAHRRLRSVRETLASPVQSLLDRPVLVLYVTVPIAIAMTVLRFPAVVADGFDVRLLDDLIVQAVLLLTSTFAVVHEYSTHRLRRLESAVPELLERLASLNEAGISIVSSFNRVRRSDIGALDEEVDRIWRDVKWGATASGALHRFEERVKTPSVTRVVTLITNAMQASNEIGPVLRIAGEQARSDLQLRRQRKQEMFTYLVVVYVSFLVFLVVIGALEHVLIPNLPDTGALSGGQAGAGTNVFGNFGGTNREAYRLVFFHTAVIQSALSGLVAGVMGSGSIKDGMKHATIMLTITYLVLTLLV
jgi:flagellar protein FlaJ